MTTKTSEKSGVSKLMNDLGIRIMYLYDDKGLPVGCLAMQLHPVMTSRLMIAGSVVSAQDQFSYKEGRRLAISRLIGLTIVTGNKEMTTWRTQADIFDMPNSSRPEILMHSLLKDLGLNVSKRVHFENFSYIPMGEKFKKIAGRFFE